MTDEAAKRLESHRNDDESFSEFAERVSSILDAVEEGTVVNEETETIPFRSDAQQDSASMGTEDLLTVEEFNARIDDLEARLPRKNADELETRLR